MLSSSHSLNFGKNECEANHNNSVNDILMEKKSVISGAESPRSSAMIRMTTQKVVGEQISLRVEASGAVSIDGVQEPLHTDGQYHNYTLTAQEVVIRGEVTRFGCNQDFEDEKVIATLEFFQCVALTELDCNFTELESLDLSKNVALTKLSCWYNLRLKSLDVTGCIALNSLCCHRNNLTSLDLTKNVALTELCYYKDGDGQKSLDLSNKEQTIEELSSLPNLKKLSYHTNSDTLDLSKLVHLTELSCCGNKQLTSLDLSKNVALTKLNCCNNEQLTSLDLSKLVHLTELDCSNNEQLASLDLSKNVALTTLSCKGNKQLKSLDLSKNVALTKLECKDNKQLTSLDLSNNVALTKLDCRDNEQLTSLTLSESVALTELHCCGNKQLTSLDLSKSVTLTT